ncbi:MAG: hypothetical protein WCE61_00550 [Candidatus Acidiferrum sp.]
MTNDDRLLELRRQRDFLRGPEFRTSVQARRDILSIIVPLLNFNEVYYSNAVPVADVLGRPGFSSSFYDQAHAQMDSIVGQAINELECGLTPAAGEMALVPTSKLTDQHGLLWFWHHCSWRVRWWLIAKAVLVSAVIFAVGFCLGRVDFFVQLWQLWHRAMSP